MDKKKLSKLTLRKEVISSLTNDELKNVKGGWTTTIGECTKFGCCQDWTLVKSCNYTNCAGWSCNGNCNLGQE